VRKLFAILVTFPLFNTAAADLHVFDAAGLTDALREITAGCDTESGLHATLNLGGSRLLARQIEETPEIRYPVAILRETKQRAAAERFVRYLGCSDAHGFLVHYDFVVQR